MMRTLTPDDDDNVTIADLHARASQVVMALRQGLIPFGGCVELTIVLGGSASGSPYWRR